ncbi:Lhr family helicase [Escherichia coli]
MLALAENMLDRYGIISRQAVIAENIPGGFPSMQTLCRSMEDSGRVCEVVCRRSGWRAIR